MDNDLGVFSKKLITDVSVDKNSEKFKEYDNKIPFFGNQATYVYSFVEGRMVYAKGWLDLLGYEDTDVNMLNLVEITSPRYKQFSFEINDKALMFLSQKAENLEAYSFTLETEKVHKNGTVIPLFWKVGVYKSINGKIAEIIGIAHKMDSLKRGKVMQYAAYGPEIADFEGMLNKELFNYVAISRKEKEALKLAAKGLSFKEIAHELMVSQSAIEKRIIPMYKRFGVKSLPHLVSFAYENHVL